jgi:photosystem II stability/assembly factor-like uncharacterized protein
MSRKFTLLTVLLVALLLISCHKGVDDNNINNSSSSVSGNAARTGSIGWGGGGWMTKVIYHPANASILYSANDMGGIFKSSDGGETWSYLSRTFHGQNVFDLAIDPVDYTLYAQSGNSIEKSVDDGANWTLLTAQTVANSTASYPLITSWKCESKKKRTIAIDTSTAPHTIYVAGEDGGDSSSSSDYHSCHVFKSADGGSTWNKPGNNLFAGPIRTIIIDPNAKTNIYVSGAIGFFKSTDSGATWTQLTNGLPDEPVLNNTETSKDLYDLCIDPVNTSVFYVRTRTHGIYKTTNCGLSWSACNGTYPDSIDLNPYSGLYNSNDHESKLYGMLVMDPVNHNRLLAAFASVRNVNGTPNNWSRCNLYETTNGGASWHVFLAKGTVADYDSSYPYKDPVVAPYAFGRTYGSSTDLAINWQDPNLAFGTDDWGLKRYIYNSTAQTTSWKMIYKGLITTCGGVSYGKIVSLNHGQRIYAAGCDTSLMKSSDWGLTWTSMLTTIIANNSANWEHGMTLEIVDTTPPTIYFGCNYVDHAKGPGGLFKSIDDGTTWTRLTAGLPSIPHSDTTINGACRQVLLGANYSSNNTLYAIFDGFGIYQSANAGTSWSNISGNLPANPRFNGQNLAIDPDNNNLYLALDNTSDHSVYKSTNGGGSWIQLSYPSASTGTIYGGATIGGTPGNRILYISGHRGVAVSTNISTQQTPAWIVPFTIPVNVRPLNDTYSWQMPCSKVVVDPTNPARVFLSTCSWGGAFRIPGAGIYASYDSGITWSKALDFPNMGGPINITDDGKGILEYANGMDVWRFDL